MMYTIFTGPNCPKCKALKIKLKDNQNIRWVDVETTEGEAEALFEEVRFLPTLLFDGGHITDLNSIIEKVSNDKEKDSQ